MLKWRLQGVAMVLIGILSWLPEHDGTAALIVIPFGLWRIFSNQDW